MKVREVAIGPIRYVHKFVLANDSVVVVATTEAGYNAIAGKDAIKPVYPQATYLMSSGRIGFDTLTKELSDGEYATQANGYHWAKIAGYAMAKLPPQHIKNNVLSPSGEAQIIELSQNE